jgi:2-methylcitrate dehydratase PrpD
MNNPASASMTVSEPARLSEIIARFVIGFDMGSAPSAAAANARRAFIDTVGVMLAGSAQPAAAIVHALIASEGSAPAATVVGTKLRASVRLAALANGVASHGMDYDLSYLMGQPVASLIPALLPLAESAGAESPELIAAFVIGFEVASRLCRANPGHASQGAWHAVGTIGTIASTAACARLLKLPADAISNAIGIAATMSGGLSVNFGTMTKPLLAGHTAQNAATAAMLGGCGYSASPVALEDRNGYFAAFGKGLKLSTEVFAELGSRFDLAEDGFTIKAYPCGGLAHPAIDAALDIRDELGPAIAQIASIDVGVTRFAARNVKNDYPSTVEAAKFSASYLTARTLVHGPPRLSAFTEAAIADPQVLALARKVSASIDPSLGDPIEIPLPARVTVILTDGRRVERVRDFALGSPGRPMTDRQVEDKFFDCAGHVFDRARSERVLEFLAKLGDGPLKDLWPLLAAV